MSQKFFKKISAQNDLFETMINEKGLNHITENLSIYGKNSIIGLYSDLKENEKVEEVVMNELGDSYSTFAKIANTKDNTHRFHHCGGSPIKTVADELHNEIKMFFNEFHK